MWSPLFFGMHQIGSAFWLILMIWVAALITTLLFGRVQEYSGMAVLPYMAWLSFAAILNYQIDALNPGAETLVVPAARTQI
ncbi:MAG: TspO/MBR family protein [Parasphingorhabdus sp.]|nr:TspO/MBR family protein [Parasphingorhabdus sp.]